jgi:hypothetical protein
MILNTYEIYSQSVLNVKYVFIQDACLNVRSHRQGDFPNWEAIFAHIPW